MNNQTDSVKLKISLPIEYLVIGHITADLTESGVKLGGTAAFSGLTAQKLGLRTGIITSFSPDLDTTPINNLWVSNKTSEHATTFKNVSDGANRDQFLFHTANRLTKADLPEWVTPPLIVHLGPVADEVDPDILTLYPTSMKCLTPQGWFRGAKDDHKVHHQQWQDCEQYLAQADIAVISQEDVQKDEERIARMASSIPIFVVTENVKGARVYWHNDARFIHAPEVKYVEDTGAGDIFATAFFYRFFKTRDPWEAGRFAVQLASGSVTRKHLDSVPTSEEIQQAKMELLGH